MSAATPLFVWLRLRLESLHLTLCVFLVLTISKSFDCVDHEAPFDKLHLEEFKEPFSCDWNNIWASEVKLYKI